ncbi:MAG: histidinol-phosphate transaminase [Thermodesulfobacteriota bacterium]
MPNNKNNYRDRLCSSVSAIKSYSVPGIDCEIKLDGNESPFELTPEIKNEIADKILSIQLNRYPDPEATKLKKSVSSFFKLPAESILFGNGSDELIQMLIETFTGKSGTVLVPRPTFSMYKLTSLLLDKNVIEVELDPNSDIDQDQILKYIRENDPDLFFFATPNNPTGNSFSEERIIKILNSTSGLVIVDEAYFDYYGETFIPLLKEYDNLIVLRTMSKIGFASIRLGILFANANLVNELNKARLPYNINSITQVIAEVAIDNYSLIEANFSKIKDERKMLFEELKKIPDIKVFPSDANFFLIKVPDADKYYNKLIEQGILVRNFNGSPGLDNCIRVTIGSSPENSKFLNAISAIALP